MVYSMRKIVNTSLIFFALAITVYVLSPTLDEKSGFAQIRSMQMYRKNVKTEE